MDDLELIKSQFTIHPDFPKKGIVFLDIMPIFRNPLVLEKLIEYFIHHITSHTMKNQKVDIIVGLDARGFLLGPIIALRLGVAFVPVRKAGKLPGMCIQASYEKEYGVDIFEMQADAIKPGQNVVVIDDVIATGGSAKAAGELVAKLGGKTLEYIFLIEVEFLKGSSKLDAPTYSIIQIENKQDHRPSN